MTAAVFFRVKFIKLLKFFQIITHLGLNHPLCHSCTVFRPSSYCRPNLQAQSREDAACEIHSKVLNTDLNNVLRF